MKETTSDSWKYFGFSFIVYKDVHNWWHVNETTSGLNVPCHPEHGKDHAVHDTRKLAIECARQTLNKVGKTDFTACVKRSLN